MLGLDCRAEEKMFRPKLGAPSGKYLLPLGFPFVLATVR